MHECDQCGKTFSWASNLKKHLKVHSKEKPHSCSVCGKTFDILTFIHLADAFIQSDLQNIQAVHIFCQYM